MCKIEKSITKMRQLRITKKKIDSLSINDFENKIVAQIACQFSSTQIELAELYAIGLKGLEKAKMTFANDQDRFVRFSGWCIRQEIMRNKRNKK
jgi:DNA-directed RNA polymerase specialized sigma subunit